MIWKGSCESLPDGAVADRTLRYALLSFTRSLHLDFLDLRIPLAWK
jgi:hypothetical protein